MWHCQPCSTSNTSPVLLVSSTIQVSFEQDVVLSQMNEYEVLQLLMGDCRERLAAYQMSLEEEIKHNQVRVQDVQATINAILQWNALVLAEDLVNESQLAAT